MFEILWQGLTISIIGLSLTFAALGLLVVVMMILVRFTAPRTEPPAPAEVMADTEDEGAVAAIAVALTQLQAADVYPETLGATLETERSTRWLLGLPQRQAAHTPRITRQRG